MKKLKAAFLIFLVLTLTLPILFNFIVVKLTLSSPTIYTELTIGEPEVVNGVVDGAYTDTHTINDVYQNITEAEETSTEYPVLNENFTSDASGWTYGENDPDGVASGSWSSTGGRTDPGCYYMVHDDTAATANPTSEQWINYTFTITSVPISAKVYASYHIITDDDTDYHVEVRLILPNGSEYALHVSSTYTDVVDTGWINVTVDASDYFDQTGTYTLKLYAQTKAAPLNAKKPTNECYWDDAGVELTYFAGYIFDVRYYFQTSADPDNIVELNVTVYGFTSGEAIHVAIYNFSVSSWTDLGNITTTTNTWSNFTTENPTDNVNDTGHIIVKFYTTSDQTGADRLSIDYLAVNLEVGDTPPSVSNVDVTNTTDYSVDYVDPETWYFLKADVDDAEGINDLANVTFILWSTSVSEDAADAKRNHYTFIWNSSGWFEIGPDPTGETHINKSACVAPESLPGTFKLVFRLSGVAEPAQWNATVIAYDADASIGYNKSYDSDPPIVSVYLKISFVDSQATFGTIAPGGTSDAQENPIQINVTANVNFNISVYGNESEPVVDGWITVSTNNIFGDEDDIILSTTAQVIYANQAWGENLIYDTYLRVSVPETATAGTRYFRYYAQISES